MATPEQLGDRGALRRIRPFVGKVRGELTEAGTVKPSTKRVDRKGRQLDTSNIGTKPKSKAIPAVAEAITPQVTVTATEPQPEASTVGILKSVFALDQKREQDRVNRAVQIKTEIANLKAKLLALEAELAAL